MNILWILCDELRTDALSCFGGAPVAVETPAIDSLAERGVLFERCFANSPVCVPARVAMHTGRFPEDTGVYGNEAYSSQYPMPPTQTFPEAFAAAGWQTADFGKEHVPRALRPWEHQDPEGAGMLDLLGADADRDSLDLVRLPKGGIGGGRFPPDRRYPPSAVVDNLLAWTSRTTQPFLVRASFLQPHTPVIPPEPWASRYHGLDWPDEIRIDPTSCRFEKRFGEVCSGTDVSPADLVRIQADYHGMVAWIDSEVARLLDGLREQGVLDHTVVVFASDHGRLLGEQGGLGKHTHAPASQQIPLIVVHPDLTAGRRSDLAQQVDLPRTMAGLADLEPIAGARGRDLFATSASSESPDVFSTIGYGEAQSFAFPNLGIGRWYDDRGWPRRSCVRRGPWRLDRNVRLDGAPASAAEEDVFLADSAADPREVVNLADDPVHGSVLAELTAALDTRLNESTETPVDVVYTTALPGVG